MVLKKLVIGSKLSIINENSTTFEGIVRTIMGDNFIIQVKTNQPNFCSKKKGDTLEYLIGFEYEAYKCVSEIHEFKMNNQFSTLVLSSPEIISQIERRKFLKLQTVIHIAYYIIPENENYEELDNVPLNYWNRLKNSYTMDISGDGLSLISYEGSDPNQCVLIRLFLYEEIKLLAKVIKSLPEEDSTKFKLYLQFEDISSKHEKLLVDYVNQNLNK